MQNQLLTFGAIFMAGTVGSALLSETALPFTLMASTTGISTTDLERFWMRVTQRLCDRDAVLRYAGLAKAMSMAIAKIMVSFSQDDSFQGNREALQRLASRAVVDWLALIKAADHPEEIGHEHSPESHLASLFGIESIDFSQIKALTPAYWSQILRNWLEKEPEWVGDASVMTAIAVALCAKFPRALREVLQEDFAVAKYASEAAMLEFWEDVRGMLQMQHDYLLIRLNRQKRIDCAQIEQDYGVVWARLDGLVAGDIRQFQDLANRVQTLGVQMDMGKANMGEFSTEARELEIPLSEGQDVVQAPSKEDVQRTESALRKFMALVDEYPLLVRLAVGLNEGDCDADELTDQASNFYLFELAELHHYDPVAILNGLVAISFGQLEERLQRLLCNVSVYRLPFTAMAATVMLKETALNWRDVAAQQFVEQDLQQLVKKSLLQVMEKPDRRYQVQPSIASALQQQGNDWSWAHERATFFYRSIAKVGCLQSEAEAQPYLETFHHHCEQQQFPLASRVLALCHNFLAARGHYALLVELYERLLQGWYPTDAQECAELGAALDNLGAVHSALGQYSQAMLRYEQALAMQGEIGDCNGEANSLMGLGNVCSLCNQINRAITLYEQSIAIRRKQVGYNPEDWIQQQQGEAHAWFKLGKTLAKVNRAADALAAYRNARQLYGEIGLKNNMIACNQAIRQITSLSKRLQRHLVLPLERIFRQHGRMGNAS